MDRKKHTLDRTAAAKGVVFEFDGARFTIASNATPEWAKAMARYERKVNPTVLKMDAAKQNDVILQAAAEVLLLDWEGVTDDGKPWPPTYDNKLQLLRDAPEFREFVFSNSRTVANYQKEGETGDGEAVKSAD